ncbi:hypothetical protein [Pedobacter sp. R-06]|uniref:hypothetical protein n=1 Tax=Pedobacter sp. R-06 TaxID=3404051 RepID=UPI003CF01C85
MFSDTDRPKFSAAESKKFDGGVFEAIWKDNVIPYLIKKSGLNLSEYARLAKLSVGHGRQIAYGFIRKFTDQSGEQGMKFTYGSKWFLKGLAFEEIV